MNIHWNFHTKSYLNFSDAYCNCSNFLYILQEIQWKLTGISVNSHWFISELYFFNFDTRLKILMIWIIFDSTVIFIKTLCVWFNNWSKCEILSDKEIINEEVWRSWKRAIGQTTVEPPILLLPNSCSKNKLHTCSVLCRC